MRWARSRSTTNAPSPPSDSACTTPMPSCAIARSSRSPGWAAIEALARIRTERSAAILAEALTADPAEAIRLRSAELLGQLLDDDAARAALIRAIADPSSEVAIAAIRALRGVRGTALSIA